MFKLLNPENESIENDDNYGDETEDLRLNLNCFILNKDIYILRYCRKTLVINFVFL